MQNDLGFEKLRFRHDENLSKWVFDMMKGGESIYPHEGLKDAGFIINDIAKTTSFSGSGTGKTLQFRIKTFIMIRRYRFCVDPTKEIS